jgi:hypothetical protein
VASKARITAGLLKWRSKLPRGAIMQPATFSSIEKKAAASGATNPKKIAGAAYWSSAKRKYGASQL